MKAQAATRSTEKSPQELQVRLVLMEEGSSPSALPCEEDVGTTAVVAIGGKGEAELAERLERRIAELSRSGRSVKEVVYLVAANTEGDAISRRREALLAVVRALRGHGVEMLLVVPHDRSAVLSSDIFGLIESLLSDGGPSLQVRVRFAATAEQRPSGFYPTLARGNAKRASGPAPRSGVAWRVPRASSA